MLAQSLPIFMTSSGVVVKKEIQDQLSYRAASRDIFFMESLGISNPTDWIRENEDIFRKAHREISLAGSMYE